MTFDAKSINTVTNVSVYENVHSVHVYVCKFQNKSSTKNLPTRPRNKLSRPRQMPAFTGLLDKAKQTIVYQLHFPSLLG